MNGERGGQSSSRRRRDEEKAVLGALAVFDRRESVGNIVHVFVPADYRIGEVVVFEDRSVVYNISLGDSTAI